MELRRVYIELKLTATHWKENFLHKSLTPCRATHHEQFDFFDTLVILKISIIQSWGPFHKRPLCMIFFCISVFLILCFIDILLFFVFLHVLKSTQFFLQMLWRQGYKTVWCAQSRADRLENELWLNQGPLPVNGRAYAKGERIVVQQRATLSDLWFLNYFDFFIVILFVK